MKIAIVSQHFYPDTFRINDIAYDLAAQGHRVQVYTGLPDYDAGRLPADYRRFRNRRARHRGVDIRRVPTTQRRTGSFWRLINYASFAISGWLCSGFAPRDFDVVLTYQTSPVSQAIPAQRLARRSRCPHLLYCLDLWPECVTVWGVQSGSLLYRVVRSISRRIYGAADRVPVCSLPFADYLHEVCDVPKDRMDYLPQPCEDLFESVSGQYEDNGCVDLLFAGNVGAAQDIPCLLDAVALLGDKPGYRVHIVGGGSELTAMEARSAHMGLTHRVIFHGRKPLEEMPAYYRMADAFLLLLKGDSFVGHTLPGKLQSYMSAGKPILAAIDGAAADVLRDADCGLCGPPSDARTLAAHMGALIDAPDSYRDLGTRAFAYYRQHFSKEAFFARLEEIVAQAQGGRKYV